MTKILNGAGGGRIAGTSTASIPKRLNSASARSAARAAEAPADQRLPSLPADGVHHEAAGQRPERRHRRIERHPLGIPGHAQDEQQVVDLRQREERRVEGGDQEQSRRAQMRRRAPVIHDEKALHDHDRLSRLVVPRSLLVAVAAAFVAGTVTAVFTPASISRSATTTPRATWSWPGASPTRCGPGGGRSVRCGCPSPPPEPRPRAGRRVVPHRLLGRRDLDHLSSRSRSARSSR